MYIEFKKSIYFLVGKDSVVRVKINILVCYEIYGEGGKMC